MALGIFYFEASVMLSGAKHLAQCVHRVGAEREILHGVYPEHE